MDKRFPEKPVDYMNTASLVTEIQQEQSKRWKLALTAAVSAVAGVVIIAEAAIAGVELIERPTQALIGLFVLGGSALAMDEISGLNTNIRSLRETADNFIDRSE